MNWKEYLKGFKFFWKGLQAAGREMWVSFEVLFALTLVFSTLLYFVENAAQPEVYTSWGDAFVWSFMGYLGNPGKFAPGDPITLVGRFLWIAISVVKIMIFAVPAGLVANGFSKAMAQDKKEKQLNDASVVLHKRFRREGQNNSWYRNDEGLKRTYKCVTRYRSLISLQMKLGMDISEIIETVKYCPDMRLNNLATAQRKIEKPQDRLVVEHFPINTEYGCFLNRGSNVTIVSTSSPAHIGMGNASFSLAAMGGFNYVSKEIELYPDEPFGFYTMNKSDLDIIGDYNIKEDIESMALHFMDDLKRLKENSAKRGQRHWFIFMLGTLKTTECQLHFWRLATDKKKEMPNRVVSENESREYGSLVLKEDEETLYNMFNAINGKLFERKMAIAGNEQNIVSELDNVSRWKSVNASNIMCRIGGGKDCNSLVLRVADEILVYCNFHLLIMKDIADSIKMFIEPEHEIDEAAKKCFMSNGDGFADDFGKEDVFIKSPIKLKKKMAEWLKEARDKYEHLDLDGNEQEENLHPSKGTHSE